MKFYSALTAEERARWRSYHAEHWRPIRDPETGKYTSVKPAPMHPIPTRGTIRTCHTRHYQMARDPATGTYRAVKPQRSKPYAHQPPRSIPMILKTTPPPRAPPTAFSTRSELYLYHKARGTLREYCAMFGIDYKPD